MLTLKAEFKPSSRSNGARAALEQAVQSLAAALARNGQVCGQEVIWWAGGALHLRVYVPRHDAVDAAYRSSWVSAEWERVGVLCSQPPGFGVLDEQVPKRYPRWQSAGSLYLFTTAFDISSPVCSGRDGTPVPPFLLPLDDAQKDDLYFWAHTYRELDSIQLGCGPLEMPAYRQMADPASELSKKGRSLCGTVEKATGMPTFYYLIRYWGRRDGESQRRCPSCDGAWRRERRPGHGLNWFDFVCEPCRLVSHEASVVGNARQVRMGEFRPRTAG